MDHLPVFMRSEQDIPLFVAGQGSLGEIRAAEDNGSRSIGLENISFGMQAALINPSCDIAVFEQLPKHCWTIEIEISRGENPAFDASIPQLG